MLLNEVVQEVLELRNHPNTLEGVEKVRAAIEAYTEAKVVEVAAEREAFRQFVLRVLFTRPISVEFRKLAFECGMVTAEGKQTPLLAGESAATRARGETITRVDREDDGALTVAVNHWPESVGDALEADRRALVAELEKLAISPPPNVLILQAFYKGYAQALTACLAVVRKPPQRE